MSSKPHYFAIGVFVLVASALGLIGVVAISSDAMRSPKYFLETYVDESVQGIDVGTPFKFRGVKVGNVSEISMVSMVYDTTKMYVMVRVALEDREMMKDQESWKRQVHEMIGQGLRLKLVPQGITGLSFLEAEFYPDTESVPLEIDWEPRYTYIPSTPAMMTLLSRSIERVAAEINTLDIRQIGLDVASITSNLNMSARHIEHITGNAAVASGSVMEDVRIAASSLPGVSTNLSDSLTMIQTMIQDSDSELDQILINLRYITEDTKDLIRTIRRHPGMLLSEPPKKNIYLEGKNK